MQKEDRRILPLEGLNSITCHSDTKSKDMEKSHVKLHLCDFV